MHENLSSEAQPDRQAPRVRRGAGLLLRVAPYALALLFAVWGLRGVTTKNLYSDAPNHLMNGALIADLIRHGEILNPILYAKAYYSRLPATTIPFHPPMFPAFESLFFLTLGVNVISARIAIAVSVALAILLLYRLIVDSGGSRLVALCAVASLFSLKTYTYLASNVMLEMPTLALVLAAMYQLRTIDKGYRLRDGLLFALFGGAAVWTKQQAVFIGLAPFLYVIAARRWRLLTGRTIWLSSALFAALVLAFSLLTVPFSGVGTATEIPPQERIFSKIVPTLLFYLQEIQEALGWIPSLWILASLLYLGLWRPRSRPPNTGVDLCLAWIPAVFLTFFPTWHVDRRYLFFLYPPMLIIAYYTLSELCDRALGARRGWYLPAATAVLCVALAPWNPPTRTASGPAEAAAFVVNGAPRRVLYCGGLGTGNFIFGVRVADPRLQTVVLRADKLGGQLSASELEQFAHRYGVEMIVAPKPQVPQPCDSLATAAPSTFVLERELPLVSSVPSLNGKISIYRFTNPSPTPEKTLRVKIPKIRGDLDLQLAH